MVNVKLLKTIIQMSQQELKEYLKTVLCDMGYITVDRKGFLYAEGDIPVLLAAHLDTCIGTRRRLSVFPKMDVMLCLRKASAGTTGAVYI